MLLEYIYRSKWRAYCALMKDWASDTMGFFFLPSLGGFECNTLILNQHVYGLLCSTTLLSVMLLICHMQQPDYWVDNVDVMTCSCYTIELSFLFATGLCPLYSRPLGLITGVITLCGFDTWCNNIDSSASGPFIRDTCGAWLYRIVL